MNINHHDQIQHSELVRIRTRINITQILALPLSQRAVNRTDLYTLWPFLGVFILKLYFSCHKLTLFLLLRINTSDANGMVAYCKTFHLIDKGNGVELRYTMANGGSKSHVWTPKLSFRLFNITLNNAYKIYSCLHKRHRQTDTHTVR